MSQVAQVPMETWPIVDEAAARLETSRRTIFRYGKAQEIEIRKRAGKSVCNPTDIERLKPATHVMPEKTPAIHRASDGLTGGPETIAVVKPQALALIAPDLSNGWTAALQIIDRFIQERPNPVPKLWLTIDEAAAYSGIPRRSVKKLCKEGKLGAQRFGRSWRIRRSSIEIF